jgi:hypothetical protein
MGLIAIDLICELAAKWVRKTGAKMFRTVTSQPVRDA